MNRIIKLISLLIIISLSIIGCGSTESSQLEITSSPLVKEEKNTQEVKQESDLLQTSEAVENKAADNSEKQKEEEIKLEVTEKATTIANDQKTKTNSDAISSKVHDKTTNVEKTETKSVNQEKAITNNKESTQKATNETKTSVTPQTKKEVSPTVTISIIGHQDIGTILPSMKVNVKEGDTVLDILLEAAKKKNFEVEYSGVGAMVYIEGIDNLYEFDYGPKSGWNFKLNGTTVSKSSGIVKVNKDDKIEWMYREDFTEENDE